MSEEMTPLSWPLHQYRTPWFLRMLGMRALHKNDWRGWIGSAPPNGAREKVQVNLAVARA